MKHTFVILAMLLGANPIYSHGANLDPEKILRYVQNGLRTCSGVNKVEHEGTSFRIYWGTYWMHEFDLLDMTVSPSIDDSTLILHCGMPGCIDTYMPSHRNSGSWTDMGPENLLTFDCFGAGRQTGQAIMFYKEKFAEGSEMEP